MRQLVQLLKRFCRSRKNWDMPNGMKLSMLVVECQPSYSQRMDVAFRNLLEKLKGRLEWNKTICNLAHPDQPQITKTTQDHNVVQLFEKTEIALEDLETLDTEECTQSDARKAWDSIFKSQGFFTDFDKREEDLASEK